MSTRTLRSARFVVLGIAGAGLAAGLLGGCNTSSHAGNENAIRANPTRALSGLGLRNQDKWNRWAYMADSNFRAYSDDVARTLYIDRPSRLHPFPKAY